MMLRKAIVTSLGLVVLFGFGVRSRSTPLQASYRQQAEFTSLAGKFLVASGSIGDPRFRHVVILLTAHTEKGAMGLVVNVPGREVSLSQLLEQVSLEPPEQDRTVSVYYGGPVQLEHLFLLHSTDFQSKSSRTVLEGVALATGSEILGQMAADKGPRDFLLLRGYAGWGPGQLEGELKDGSWFVKEAGAKLIFTDQPHRTWEQLMKGHRL